MLRAWQAVVMALVGAAMWAFVTFRVGAHPEAPLDQGRALVSFLTSPVVGALSVWICKAAGRLKTDQLVAGVTLTGAVAMMMDGAAIRWRPELYGLSDRALMLTGGGLMWMYGVSFAVALAWAAWAPRKAAA
jgi:hypothetical protein